jgi:LacI family transcriptional regulator
MSLREIAAALGLSVTTVSRALAGHGDVAAPTRARVAAEADRRGYSPNPLASRLRRGRSEAVAVVVPAEPGHFNDPFFTELLLGLGEALSAVDLELLVCAARPGAEEMKAYRRLVEGRRVDGVVLARMRVEDERAAWLQARGFPFVCHGRTQAPRPVAGVDTDGEAAVAAATRRLIELGHRRIAMIGALSAYSFARDREAGWRRALAAARLAPGPLLAAEPSEEEGHRLAGAMLAARDAPTAIVCATDRLAIGALAAIAGAGLRAGRDVSVIGFDDLPAASWTDPPLTTIRNPARPMAKRLVEMLCAIIGGRAPGEFAELFDAPLVPRASDGPPPRAASRPRRTGTLQGGPHDDTTDPRR